MNPRNTVKLDVLDVVLLDDVYANYRRQVWRNGGPTMDRASFAKQLLTDEKDAYTEDIDGRTYIVNFRLNSRPDVDRQGTVLNTVAHYGFRPRSEQELVNAVLALRPQLARLGCYVTAGRPGQLDLFGYRELERDTHCPRWHLPKPPVTERWIKLLRWSDLGHLDRHSDIAEVLGCPNGIAACLVCQARIMLFDLPLDNQERDGASIIQLYQIPDQREDNIVCSACSDTTDYALVLRVARTLRIGLFSTNVRPER